MMNLKVFKNMFNILLVAICVFAYTITVNAADNGQIDCEGTYIKEGKLNYNKVKKDFGLKIEKSGNKYKISVNPLSSLNDKTEERMKKVKFIVNETVPVSNEIGKFAQAGSPMTLTINGSDYDVDLGKGVMVNLYANFVADGAKLCKGKDKFEVKFTMFSADLQGPHYEVDAIVVRDSDYATVSSTEIGNKIDCNGTGYKTTYPQGSFEYLFCEAKYKAIHGNEVYTSSKDAHSDHTMVNFKGVFDDDSNYAKIVKGSDGKVIARNFKCNTKVNRTYEAATSGMTESSTPDQYYADNTKYLYGSGSKLVDKGKYKYHFWNSNVTYGKAIQCKVKCEESVIAKYGPPVATRAGSCFDYRIEVESRVNCYLEDEPEKPDIYTKVCSPTPICDGIWNQGGPNEDFDECIHSCDGGQYSEKCNDKCYKSIYGNDENVKNTNLDISYNVKKIASDSTFDYVGISKNGNKAWNSAVDGYYIYDDGMHWYPGNHKARWYFHHSWGLAGYDYSQRTEAGIPRALDCTDYCYWRSDCGSTEYLNHGLSEEDQRRNLELYNQAINECKAMLKCSTTTAEYKISASYKKPTGETTFDTVTIEYPTNQSDHKDKLSTCTAEEKENTSTTPGTTIINYDGCYKNECGNQNYYMTEWTFPGAWVNKKSGEISFEDKSKDKAWRSKPKQYCIPRDAGEVNAKWGRWYYIHRAGIPKEELCPCEDVTDESISESNYNYSYNINGKAIKFGYYKWYIDFKCFYSVVNSGPTNEKSESAQCKPCGDTTEYRIRTVSNTELFPSSTGTTTSSGTTQGRVAGYNWTSKATLTAAKANENYANNPENVLAYIQKEGEKIYNSDSYVDYEFRLTPTDLKNIREYNKNKDFGVFCGEVSEASDVYNPNGGIAIYNSNLFRQGTAVDTKTWASQCANANSHFISAKKMGILGCNNQESGRCKTDF